MRGSSMIPILISPEERGLFILATSGIMTRWSRSTTAGSTFLLDGVGLPAVGCGCGCRLSVGPADCTAHPAASTMSTRVLKTFIWISSRSISIHAGGRSHPLADAVGQHGEGDLLTVGLAPAEGPGPLP